MDENGIVINSKVRLVSQGYNQQEEIAYEETFALVVRLEAIRVFLAYAAYMGFMVYQMDVKSAFLNGKISEEVYVQQPPGYQANPKESHLVAVKRILWYLKGTSNLSLWYPKGSGFDLKAYYDSDYAGCNPDRKSTSGGCQILGGKLMLLDVVLKSSGSRVGWMPIFCDNTSAIAISNNPVLHSRTKHIDIRYHFIRDHILKGDIKLHFVPTDLQLVDIFTKPLVEPSFTRLVAELESSSFQQSHQLLPSSKVNFRCEEGIIAFSNAIALLEHLNELYRPMLSFLSNYCINKALTLQPSAMYVEY
ncbi:retrovirus-related pol polyprotein from transposon TNT 1-94 [Tanacetum coccineum]